MSHEQLAQLLSAYLDGEVNAREREYIERELARDESARALLADLRSTRELTASLPRQRAPEAMAGDVIRLLERQALLGDANVTPYQATGSWRPWRAMLSMAAALAIVITGGWWYMRPTGQSHDLKLDQVAMVMEENEAHAEGLETRKSTAKRSTDMTRMARSRSRKAPGSVATIVPNAVEKSASDRPMARTGVASTPAILDQAHTEQRLATGEKLDFLPSHAFRNEPVRLRLVMRDVSQLEQVREAFKKQLDSQGLVDAGARTTLTKPTKLRRQSFYYEGRTGQNFRGDNQSQMLVRIPIDDMQTLLDHIAVDGVRDKDVTLSAGPLVVRGLAQAQTSLTHFQQTPTPVLGDSRNEAMEPTVRVDEKTKKSVEVKESEDDILAEIIKAIGLPEDVFTFTDTISSDDTQSKKLSTEREASGQRSPSKRRDDAHVVSTSPNDSNRKDADESGVSHSPLVERREAALRQNVASKREKNKSVGRALADKVHPTAKASVSHAKTIDQQFITLVVEFVAPSKDRRPMIKPATGTTSRRARPTSTKPRENVKAKSTKGDQPKQ